MNTDLLFDDQKEAVLDYFKSVWHYSESPQLYTPYLVRCENDEWLIAYWEGLKWVDAHNDPLYYDVETYCKVEDLIL